VIARPFGDNPHAHVASLTLPPKPHDVHTSQRFSAPKTAEQGTAGALAPPADKPATNAFDAPKTSSEGVSGSLPPPVPPLPPPADGYMQALPQPPAPGGNVNVFA
jgi:hypothetical protein